MFRPSHLAITWLSLVLAGCAAFSDGESAAPTVTEVTPRPTPTPTPVATSSSTPLASATPAPTPSPTPDPAALDLEVWSCNGGVVLHWSASVHPAFHHYTALRSPESEIAPHYPPIAPAVDWGDTYATDRFVTSAVDSSIIPSETTWYYRVMAYDVEGAVVGSSSVITGQLKQVIDLGPVTVEPAADGRTAIRWAPFRGSSLCFTHYRVMYGTLGTPSTVLTVVSGRETTELLTDALHAATTYQVQVQAVRTTTLGGFVAGETEVASYVAP